MKILKKKPGKGVGAPAIPTSDPAPPWENPLIPSIKLRELYAAMVELRLLEDHLAKPRRGRKPSVRPASTHGEEGCRASTVLSLKPGDLTSEPAPGLATPFLRGAKLAGLLTSGPAKPDLPPAADPTTRLHLAIGAALTLASRKNGPLVLAYVYASELGLREWKPILRLASDHAAPVLIVVLPGLATRKNSQPDGQLSLTATACGVPGIPVDSADPVALYRVAQEATLRIRSGGGPVLMECIPFRIPGKPVPPSDPILTMQQFLLPRGVATQDWFQSVAARFAARINNIPR